MTLQFDISVESNDQYRLSGQRNVKTRFLYIGFSIRENQSSINAQYFDNKA